MFKKKYEITQGKYGLRMSLFAPWSVSIETTIKAKNIVELELNYAKGWKAGTPLSFLKTIPHLLGFQIIDHQIEDVLEVHSLRNLIGLDINTDCYTEIDFSCFPQLEEVAIEWREGASSLYDCTTLKHVFINNCSAKSLEVFRKLGRLEYLSLKSPRLEMIGKAPTLRSLSFLGIYNAGKLSSLAGVEQFPNLEMLEIERCRKILDITPVASLRRLRRLMIANCGEIESLKPVEELKELREVFFHESTNVRDGDLMVLKALPYLEDVSFQERRHYNCRRDDLPARGRWHGWT
jgi:hypothetical protein